jgi:hypothetical protein
VTFGIVVNKFCREKFFLNQNSDKRVAKSFSRIKIATSLSQKVFSDLKKKQTCCYFKNKKEKCDKDVAFPNFQNKKQRNKWRVSFHSFACIL